MNNLGRFSLIKEKMENLNDSINLQIEFERFKKKYKDDLCRFIGYEDDADLLLDQNAKTFYFAPKEKKIGIPLEWFKKYVDILNDNSGESELHKIHGKFGLAHEFSHFRDMLKEKDITKKSSMYSVLKRLSGRKIKISDKEYIPIGKMVHTIYNCIDDIIVNYEVKNFTRFGIDSEILKTLYQRVLFPDYKVNKDEKDVIENEQNPEKVKKQDLNLDGPVNYSGIADYTAISYYYLRKKMVPDQKIILSNNLNTILFNENGRNLPWGSTLKNLKKLFNEELDKAKESRDPIVKDRYKKLQGALLNQRYKLDQLDTVKITKLLQVALKFLSSYDVSRVSPSTLSLETIIDLFTVNKGGDDAHMLCILPDLRYQIYEALFEPIIETLILIHALFNEINGGDLGEGVGNGEGGGEGNGEGGYKDENGDNENETENDKNNNEDKNKDKNGKEDGDGDDDSNGEGGNKDKNEDDENETGNNKDKNNDQNKDKKDEKDGDGDDDLNSASKLNPNGNTNKIASGKGSYNRSLEDALKFIKDAAEYHQNKEQEAMRKKQAKKVGQSIIEVLDSKGINPKDWEFKEEVQKNFLSYVEDITKILYEELYAVDIQKDTTNIISKKGTLNYNEFMKEFSKSFVDGDFSEKSIYDRSRNIEKIKEEFKKLCFYFMIDVSGSTEGFKGENGLLNGVPLALALSIKNVEKAIQNLSGDPSYTIPIKFIIYTDCVNYFTKDKDLEDMEAEMVKVNSAIAKISGGTNDTHSWIIAGQQLSEDLKHHPEYIDDIKGGKMKPVVVQIADQDVSDDGVDELKRIIKGDFGEDVNTALEPKRIILGQKIEFDTVETPEDYGLKKKNWKREYMRGPDGQILLDKYGRKKIKVKEIGIRKKSEIVDEIKKLFKNFFGDIIREIN